MICQGGEFLPWNQSMAIDCAYDEGEPLSWTSSVVWYGEGWTQPGLLAQDNVMHKWIPIRLVQLKYVAWTDQVLSGDVIFRPHPVTDDDDDDDADWVWR